MKLKNHDGRLNINISHCCVHTMNHTVPVEFVTAVLSKAILDAGGVEQAIRNIGWGKEFTDELIAQIEES